MNKVTGYVLLIILIIILGKSCSKGQQMRIDEAYKKGYEEGKVTHIDYSTGYGEGYDVGYEEGYEKGRKAGYSYGFSAGQSYEEDDYYDYDNENKDYIWEW